MSHWFNCPSETWPWNSTNGVWLGLNSDLRYKVGNLRQDWIYHTLSLVPHATRWKGLWKDTTPKIKLVCHFCTFCLQQKRWNMVLDIVINNSPLSKQSNILSLDFPPLNAPFVSPTMNHSIFPKWGGSDPSSSPWRSSGFACTLLQQRVLAIFHCLFC